jgi:hypothetical protein
MNTLKKLQKLRDQIRKAEQALKPDFLEQLSDLGEIASGLAHDTIHGFVTDPRAQSILNRLGLEVRVHSSTPHSTASPKAKPGKRAATGSGNGKRAPKGQQAALILKALADGGKKTAEIARAIDYKGANLSAVLAGMMKAKKIKKSGGEWFKA